MSHIVRSEVEERKLWVTSDGMKHDSKSEAHDHQKRLNAFSTACVHMKLVPDSGLNIERLAWYIVNNASPLRALLADLEELEIYPDGRSDASC